MRRVFVHALAGAGVLLLTALVVVGGLLGSPGQTSTALAGGKATPQAPTVAEQGAIREAAGTSRDSERAALSAAANQRSLATDRRVAAQEKQERAIAEQQKVLAAKAAATAKAAAKAKAEALRQQEIAAEKARLARVKAQGYEPGTTDPKTMAQQILQNKFGYGADQFSCFNNIIMRESEWDVTATNASSGAYGIPQALPGSKMASVASDWRTNPATQIIWAVHYMDDTYGSPCSAWGFKSAHGWY